MKRVALKAKATVRYGIIMEISDDDYAEYERLLSTYDSEPAHKVDYKLEMWAGGVGLLDHENVSDIYDYTEIECIPVTKEDS